MRVAGTLSVYFGRRFALSALGVFAGMTALIALVDCIETMRRASDVAGVSMLAVAQMSLFRVPQTTEKLLPFCILIAAMSCYLGLSRRLELVVARAAGLSAWQFIAPASAAAFLIGLIATAIYNPLASSLHERATRIEGDLLGDRQSTMHTPSGNFWVRQLTPEGQAIVSAQSSRAQGVVLSGVSVFTFDTDGKFTGRIEARSATLEPGRWRLEDARIYAPGRSPIDRASHMLSTNLTPEQVRESFATPETVPFWQLPSLIAHSEHAGIGASGYRLQFQKLLARPFLLAAMVLVAAVFSLRFFRLGGVQKAVLAGIGAGFALFVIAKVCDDLARADIMPATLAAWFPAFAGATSAFLALLHREDG